MGSWRICNEAFGERMVIYGPMVIRRRLWRNELRVLAREKQLRDRYYVSLAVLAGRIMHNLTIRLEKLLCS